MEFNKKENVCFSIKSDDERLMEFSPVVERKNLVDAEGSVSDEGYKDIADLLPNDPFGMEFNIGLPVDPFDMDFKISLPADPFGMDFGRGTTFKAVTGWIEEFSLKGFGFESDQAPEDKNNADSKIVAGLNFYWTSSMEYEQKEGDNEILDHGLRAYSKDGSDDEQDKLGGEVNDLMCFGCEKYGRFANLKDNNDSYGGDPADALFFSLSYLGVKDLLSVERVCKSLQDAVREEIPIWKNIRVDHPLNGKITDDGLLGLTNRAKGNLSSLSLVKCSKITNTGLKRLSVQGCRKLSIDCILHDLKAFNSVAYPGIKQLRIGELQGLTIQHYTEFNLLLGTCEDKKAGNYKPRFFRAEDLYLSLDDERAIDIEMCPRCHQVKEVYDCPADTCREKIHSANACRGCIFCISRCISCGCCLDNKAYEETFCLDLLCLDCLSQLFNCREGHACFHQKASYHFFLRG
ncbi:F-box family protein [Striga asiatica]|uniref:F-box family protein n=1 Tax=Striga asiatica TaxID=4170 RepID=A0A5A7PAK0_STRAF|nr:F-box family protein [Striga asiatica]